MKRNVIFGRKDNFVAYITLLHIKSRGSVVGKTSFTLSLIRFYLEYGDGTPWVYNFKKT